MRQMLDRLVSKPMRQKGFAQAEIVGRWREIVGNDLADAVVPVSLRMPRGERMGGTLEVRTESAFAPILQMREAHLIERINSYYGFGAVARLSIRQGPLPRRSAKMQRQARALNKAEEQELSSLLSPHKDSDLAKVLERLGREVYGQEGDKDDK